MPTSGPFLPENASKLSLDAKAVCVYNGRTARFPRRIKDQEVIMATTTITAKANSSRKRSSAVRSGRLGLRTTPIQAALIQRAAEATRKSVTEFVLSSVCEKAEQTLLDQRLFMVDEQTWLAFQDVLERPVQTKKGLQSLIAEPAIWEK